MAVVLRPAHERHFVKATATDSVHGHQQLIQEVVRVIQEVVRAELLPRSSPASRRGRSLVASSCRRNRRERSRGDAAVCLRDRPAGSADRDR
jgi:hypothetical protein